MIVIMIIIIMFITNIFVIQTNYPWWVTKTYREQRANPHATHLHLINKCRLHVLYFTQLILYSNQLVRNLWGDAIERPDFFFEEWLVWSCMECGSCRRWHNCCFCPWRLRRSVCWGDCWCWRDCRWCVQGSVDNQWWCSLQKTWIKKNQKHLEVTNV